MKSPEEKTIRSIFILLSFLIAFMLAITYPQIVLCGDEFEYKGFVYTSYFAGPVTGVFAGCLISMFLEDKLELALIIMAVSGSVIVVTGVRLAAYFDLNNIGLTTKMLMTSCFIAGGFIINLVAAKVIIKVGGNEQAKRNVLGIAFFLTIAIILLAPIIVSLLSTAILPEDYIGCLFCLSLLDSG